MRKIFLTFLALLLIIQVNGQTKSKLSAEQVIERYIEAIGGKETIKKIKTMRIVTEGLLTGETPISQTYIMQYPGKMRKESSMKGELTGILILKDSSGYRLKPGQRIELDGQLLKLATDDSHICMDLDREELGFSYQLAGRENLKGRQVYKIERVDRALDTVTLYFDAESFLLVKSEQLYRTHMGNAKMGIEYSDYREVPGSGGFKIPFTEMMPIGDRGLVTVIDVKEAVANIALDDQIFEQKTFD